MLLRDDISVGYTIIEHFQHNSRESVWINKQYYNLRKKIEIKVT
jgi:hypothetical protein